jgi:uncharacterized membrane protein
VIRRWLFPLLIGVALAVIAYEATLVETPRLLMAAALRRVERLGGVNVLRHPPMATAAARTIVRPSPDLAYSSCVFDLSGGPVLVEAAPVPALYWSLSVFDARTDVAFVRNNRDSGGAPIRVALALAGQSVPAGIETVRLRAPRGIALIRILVETRERFPAIDRARRASRCRRL